MPTATVNGKCRRCGGPIELGQEFAWGQNKGERVHSYLCGQRAPAPASTGGGAPAASMSSGDWSVSVEEHVSEDRSMPTIYVTKLSRIRMSEQEVNASLATLLAMFQKRKP